MLKVTLIPVIFCMYNFSINTRLDKINFMSIEVPMDELSAGDLDREAEPGTNETLTGETDRRIEEAKEFLNALVTRIAEGDLNALKMDSLGLGKFRNMLRDIADNLDDVDDDKAARLRQAAVDVGRWYKDNKENRVKDGYSQVESLKKFAEEMSWL